jgi:hypothetical protein
MTLEKIPRGIALWCWPYLVAKCSHAGVDVDGLACPLHRPMNYSRQMRGHGFLPGTCIIEFYTERIAFTRIYLPYVGIIMVCMHVSLVKLPFQVVMGQILVLECILSGVRGLLLPHPILSGSECHRPSRP